MNRKELQTRLQQAGMNRFDARRRIYGPTLKMAIAPGRGVQLAITKAEKARREALHGAIDREAEASGTEG